MKVMADSKFTHESVFSKFIWATQRVANKITCSIKGSLLGNKITAYWFARIANCGDLITPLVLREYGFTPVHSSIRRAQVLSTGSLLQWAPEDYTGHIVGSGLMKDTVHHFKKATIWAVRGELTRQRIGAPKDVVLGDPGLLASRLLKKRQSKRYTLGIIPHFVDKKDPRISKIKKKYENHVLIIDVIRQPLAVFEDIDKCEFILSLHGIIFADSFGIPNAWIYLSDNVVGEGFKFYDYCSAIGTSLEPLYLDGNESLSELLKYPRKQPAAIEEVKERLDNTFRSLKSYLALE